MQDRLGGGVLAASYIGEGDQAGAAVLFGLGGGFLLVWLVGILMRMEETRVWPLVPGTILIAIGALVLAQADPKLVGQSGTERPASLLVTSAPATIRIKVALAVKIANQCRPRLYGCSMPFSMPLGKRPGLGAGRVFPKLSLADPRRGKPRSLRGLAGRFHGLNDGVGKF